MRPNIRANIADAAMVVIGRETRIRRWYRGRAASGHLGIQFRKGKTGLEVQLFDLQDMLPLGWCSLEEKPYFHNIFKMEMLPFYGLRDEGDILDLMDSLGSAPLCQESASQKFRHRLLQKTRAILRRLSGGSR